MAFRPTRAWGVQMTILNTYSRWSQWQDALRVLFDSKEDWSPASFNSCLSSLSRGARIDLAMWSRPPPSSSASCTRVGGGMKAPILLTVLRLLFLDPLPVYTFYLSFLDGYAGLIAFLELWYFKGADVAGEEVDVVGYYINCISNDVFSACFSLDVNFKGECLPRDGENYMGFVNLGCLLICLVVAVCPAIAMIAKGELDCRKGGYLARVWDFESSPFYRLAASMLMFYTFLAIFLSFVLSSTEMSGDLVEALWESFLWYQVANVILLISSAWALTQSQRPRFDYHTDSFQELTFNRCSWDVLLLGDGAFGQQLETACLWALAGRKAELRPLLQDASMADTVAHICLGSLVDSEDGEESAEDDEDDDSPSLSESWDKT